MALIAIFITRPGERTPRGHHEAKGYSFFCITGDLSIVFRATRRTREGVRAVAGFYSKRSYYSAEGGLMETKQPHTQFALDSALPPVAKPAPPYTTESPWTVFMWDSQPARLQA